MELFMLKKGLVKGKFGLRKLSRIIVKYRRRSGKYFRLLKFLIFWAYYKKKEKMYRN